MAFTVKGEYERLMKKFNTFTNGLPFECGCVCGYVNRIKYIPRHYNEEVHRYMEDIIEIYTITAFHENEELAFTITENDVCKRYQDRKYRYNNKYGILEYFPYK